MDQQTVSRREFLKASSAAGALGVGIFAFPPGLEIVKPLTQGVLQVTRSYTPLKVAQLSELTEGQPVDFQYPLQEHNNFLVKLGTPAFDGVGPNEDIVAFNYLCSHMGCPLNGQYRHEHKMLGPCSCHYSRFDLSKNGVMVLGQATQSLPQIVLEVQGDEVFAVAVMGLVYGAWNNLENGTPLS